MKILLVDDEDDIRKVGRLSLAGVGKFDVTTANSAQEGLRLARETRPDVILMDMMMPEMDGLQALAEILEDDTLAQIPVIFMTAKIQDHEVERYIAAGAVGVIRKPFDPMTLPDQVRSSLS